MGRDFRKMEIWRLAYNLTLDFYPIIGTYPEFEVKNLSDQTRRAVTSMPINIAEGAGSHSNKVFLTYLGYAYKSAKEVDVLLMLARDLKYIEDDVYLMLEKKLEEFKAKLYKFLVRVEQEVIEGRPNFNYYRPDSFERLDRPPSDVA